MDYQDIYRDVYRTYDIKDLLQSVGVKMQGSGRNHVDGAAYCLCPLPFHSHHKKTPSFSIFTSKDHSKQLWKCHGSCNLIGDVIDLAGYLWVQGYDPKTNRREAVERLTNGRVKASIVVMAEPPKPLPNWLWEDTRPMSDQVREYAHKRGLTDEIIEKYRLGSGKEWMREGRYNIRNPGIWMTIPTFHSNELIGIQMRNISDVGIRFCTLPGSTGGVWNYNAVWGKQSAVYLKGAIAGMVFSNHTGFEAVCGPSNGERQRVDVAKTVLFAAQKVLYVGDNDKTGIEASMTRGKELGAKIYIPPIPMDIDKWILNEPERIKPDLDNLVRWLSENVR